MYEGAVQNLIDELGRLPGVGPKSAQRIAFYILIGESKNVPRVDKRTFLYHAHTEFRSLQIP